MRCKHFKIWGLVPKALYNGYEELRFSVMRTYLEQGFIGYKISA
jgi:hypothetical protein